jgi:hypothetical protein
MSLSLLIMIYYSLFHSTLSYGIIFWGKASNGKITFFLQKRVLQIMTEHRNRSSCRNLFKQLVILPLKSHIHIYIYIYIHINTYILCCCFFKKIGITLLQTLILIISRPGRITIYFPLHPL